MSVKRHVKSAWFSLVMLIVGLALMPAAVAAPVITSITPSATTAGAAGFTLTVTGVVLTPFDAGATVTFGGAPVAVTSNTTTQIAVTIPPSLVATAGAYAVVVTNPTPTTTLGATPGASSALTFTVTNPAPTLVSLSPPSALQGNGGVALTLTLSGAGFVNTGTPSSSSSVQFGSTTLTPTFTTTGAGLTSLTVSVPAGDPNLATPGPVSVTVTNPQPGGGTSVSNPVTFTVTTNPAPTLSSLSPSSVTAGAGPVALTLTGSGFVMGATVTFGGDAGIAANFVSSTQLTATIPAADMSAAGTFSVSVVNPAPGGGPSNALTFTVTNPGAGSGLTVTGLTPGSITAGSAAFSLMVTGTGFVGGATVNFGGNVLTPNFVAPDGTQLIVTVPANSVVSPGTLSVTVTNPSPGGGTSNPFPFTINNPAPTLSSLSPSSVTAGAGPVALTLTGSGFVMGATVTFGGDAGIAANFVSSTQLTATIPAADMSVASNDNISVTNPAPGGGASNALNFVVVNPGPPALNITALSPASVSAGHADFTLTVTGTGFVNAGTAGASSSVNFNGTSLTPVLTGAGAATAGSLTVTVPAALVATAGTVNVSVQTPGPGGGTSNALPFMITNAAPVISSLDPASVTAGQGNFTLTISGSGFIPGATVNFGSAILNPNAAGFSGTGFTVTVPGGLVNVPGTVTVNVTNPGGATSNDQPFTVSPIPAPQISGLNPNSVTAGSGDFVLTVTGTNFGSGATVNFGSTALTPGSGSSLPTTLVVTVPGALIDRPTGSTPLGVTITNSGGATSNVVPFTVVAPPSPVITALNPSSATAGTGDFTLTIQGSNFSSPGAVVNFGSASLTPSATTSSRITVTVPGSLISRPTVASTPISITITNSNGDVSNSQPFTVVNPAAPTVTSLSPPSVTAGAAAFPLTITGTGFNNTSLVTFGGTILTPASVQPTQLSVMISASLVANVTNPGQSSAGQVAVVVTNTLPDGTAAPSAPAMFTIDPPTPTLNLLTDTPPGLVNTSNNTATAVAGSGAFPLTVTGTGFNGTTQVTWNDGHIVTVLQPNAPPNVNASGQTILTVTVPSPLVASAGTATVAVVNTTPDGTTYPSTGSDTFTINNPGAAIAPFGVSPASVTADDPAITANGSFTLTITGTGFVNGTTAGNGTTVYNGTKVYYGAAELATQFISSTQLSATVPAAAGTGFIATAGRVQITVNNPPYTGSPTPGQPFVVSPIIFFDAAQNGASPLYQMISVPFDYAAQQLSPYDALGMVDVSSMVANNSNTAGMVAALSLDGNVTQNAPLVQWVPQLADYVFAPNTPADVLRIGQGYWARFPATIANVSGQVGLIRRGAVAAVNPQPISLTAGWNMIGDPFQAGVPLTSLRFLANGNTYDADQAVELGLVGPYLYNYDTDSRDVTTFMKYVAAPLDNGQALLLTGKGYWIHVFSPCTVLVPQP